MNYRFAITRLLNHVPYFRNFNDVTNTAARCSSPSDNFNFHCHMPLKNAKFNLFGSENTSWQIMVANTDWLLVTVIQAAASKI